MKKNTLEFKVLPALSSGAARLRLLAAALLAASVPPGAGALTPGEMEEYFCRQVKRPFFSPAGPVAGGTLMRNARPGSLPAEFTLPKPAGALRVFVAGESAAALLGRETNSELAAALSRVYPGRQVELINCGMGAYESRRIQGVVEEILAYGPDLVIVLSGNNENGKEFCPDFASELVRRSRNLRSKLAALSLPEDESVIRAGLAIHEERLRAMARLAAGKGVPVVFCTLPANQRGYAPDGDLPLELPGFVLGAAALEKRDYAGALEHLRAALAAAPREPFSLFYAGRALEGLGRQAEAAAYYGQAVTYDKAGDRCSPGRNEMIRRVAREEGAGLADLERAFSGIAGGGVPGGREIADGVHWFSRYNGFVAGVIAEAARAAQPRGAGAKAAGDLPAPGAPHPEDFRTRLSYAAAALAPEKFCDALPGERAVALLESLCSADCPRLERALASDKNLAGEVLESFWRKDLKGAAGALRPALLHAAGEMLRRRGDRRAALALAGAALALENEAAGLKLQGACPSLNLLRGRLLKEAGDPGAGAEFALAAASPALRKALAALDGPLGLGLSLALPPVPEGLERPVAAREAASKKLSDAAVEALRAGNRPRARELLLAAVAKDPDNFEARMSLCFLAAGLADSAPGEEHCGEAVYLASFPRKHAILPADSRAAALLLRGEFYRQAKSAAEACRDFRAAEGAAPAGWPRLGEARRALGENCPAE